MSEAQREAIAEYEAALAKMVALYPEVDEPTEADVDAFLDDFVTAIQKAAAMREP